MEVAKKGRRRRRRDTESKTRTPHKDMGKKKRWLKGGELLEGRDIYLKEEFPQTHSVVYLSNRCQYTCIYLHTYTHITTHTFHHITSHLHYLTKCFRDSLQFGKLFGFPLLPVFPCYLQRIGCSISHFARCFHCF